MNLTDQIRKNICLKVTLLIRYYDLGFVLNNLEDLIRLPIHYKESDSSQQLYNDNKNIALETMEKSDKTLEALINELELRRITFEYLRTINPNFCKNINKNLTEEEYKEYLSMLKKCSTNLTNFIVSFNDNKNYKNNYNMLLLSKKDTASNIMDNETNSQLAYIQDVFVLKELDSLDVIDANPEIQQNITILKEQLQERISKYKDYEKLYSAENKIILKSKNNQNVRE